MTVNDHYKWMRYWLKIARAEVKLKNWLSASDCFRAAEHHSAVIQAVKLLKKTK